MFKKVEKLMKKNKMSYYKLAKEVGVSQQAVTLWKTGKCEPSFRNIVKIAKIFDVDLNYFMQ